MRRTAERSALASASPMAVRALVLGCCLLATGCAAPFGVRRASPQVMHRTLTDNVLSDGKLSNTTEIMLRRQNLIELYDSDPAAALGILRSRLQAGDLPAADLYAMSELAFHCAADRGGKPYYLASAVYAYAFLFPDDPQAAPGPFDPLVQEALDIYDRALTEALRSGDYVEVAAGTHALPFGQIALGFDDQQLMWADRRLVELTPAEDVDVVGFRNRYRQAGVGVPLAAATKPLAPVDPEQPFIVGPSVRVRCPC
ncbi:MAG: hypothetical protein ACRERC_16125 [Candidatus Binatia bacterium]